MKKIAWLVHKNYTIFESRIYKQAHSLKKRGWKVKIFAIRSDNKFKRYEDDNGILIHRIDFPFLRFIKLPMRKFTFIVSFWTIKAIIKIIKYNPDVIHCSNLFTVHIGIIYKYFFNKKCKCIYDSHELFIEQNRWNSKSKIMKDIVKKYEGFITRKVDVVFHTTQKRSEIFEKYYGIAPSIIRNKPIYEHITEFEIPIVLKEIIKSNVNIIGYVGSIHPNRGLEEIIEATKNINNIKLVAMGYAYSDWAKDFLQKNEKTILWIPPVPPNHIIHVLKHFSLGLTLIQNSCLSYYYSCPTKVYEFIVAGVPQLSSNFPEINELICNKGNPLGRTVDPSNIYEIKKNIIEMIENEKLMNYYRNNCFNAREENIWNIEEGKLLRIYDDIL